MGLKTKIAMAMGTSAAGAAMLVGGSFALFSDYKYVDSNPYTAGTVKLKVQDGQNTKMSAGDLAFNNMAPGDTGSQTFTITNNGSLDEWVALESTAKNVDSNGNDAATGLFTSFDQSKDSDAGATGNYHGLAEQGGLVVDGTDTTAGGDFTSDKHPAFYYYTVTVDGTTVASEGSASGGFSGNDWTGGYQHPFILPVGKTAVVTYSLHLPIAAHNDYQGLSGALNVEADAVQLRNNWYKDGDSTKTRQDGTPTATDSPKPYSWQPDSGK